MADFFMRIDRFLPVLTGCNGSRLCENALNTSETESREGCLWNQRAEARITLVSYIDVRNAVWVRISAHRDRPFRYIVTDHFANA